jgi:protein SCO1
VTRARRTPRWLRPAVAVAAVVWVANAAAQVTPPPDEKKTLGTTVPDVELVSEDSTTFRLSSLAGKPIILNPVFTSCPYACPQITGSLRDALATIGEPGVGYQVLTVSFDPKDGPAQLRAYRDRLALPAGWRLAVATPDNLARLLAAIDFRTAPLDGGGFAHANVIAFLSPALAVSGYAHGIMFTPDEVRTHLEDAARETSLVHHYRKFILAAGVAAAIAAALALGITRGRGARA